MSEPLVLPKEPKDMIVKELKEYLGILQLDTSGTKAVLVARLEQAMAGGEEAEAEGGAEAEGEAEAEAPAEAAAEPANAEQAESAQAGQLSEAEKAKKRAERFGLTISEDDELKKKKRAERFGIPLPGQLTAEQQAELEKKKQRAERFGIPISLSEFLSSSCAIDPFLCATGWPVLAHTGKVEAELSKLPSLFKIYDLQDEQKKKRAQRFGIPVSLEGKPLSENRGKFKKWGIGKRGQKNRGGNGGNKGNSNGKKHIQQGF